MEVLQRLPREIHVLLANVDHKDPKALATRADELWALHDNAGTSHSTVSVVQPEGQKVEFVAAVRSGSQRGGNSRGGARGGNRGRGGHGGARGGGAAHEPEASKEAQLAAGMCFKHWRYGDAATSFTLPCSWQGNGGAGGNITQSPPANFYTCRMSCPAGGFWSTLARLTASSLTSLHSRSAVPS